MIDFKELSTSGIQFELLIREIFIKLNYEVQWSGVGPDRGKDLIAIEESNSIIGKTKNKWLIQCKHNAHSGKSIGLEDIGDFVSACRDHDVTHYLIVCSTQLSSSLMERIESISTKQKITIQYWDATKIEKILNQPDFYDIFQMFFPLSSNDSEIKIYATQQPNEWIFIYQSYYIILENRIFSSTLSWAHNQIKSIINEINEIKEKYLTENEYLIPRKIWFNGKSPEFVWHIDYLYDAHNLPERKLSLSKNDIKVLLNDGYVKSDGQAYYFEIELVSAYFHSDHFHENHYDYYKSISKIRAKDFSFRKYIYEDVFNKSLSNIEKYLQNTVNILKNIESISVLNSKQDSTKNIITLSENANWESLFETGNIDEFFGPRLIISTEDEEQLLEVLSGMQSGVDEVYGYFDLVKRFVYDDKLENNDNIYDLKFKVLFARNYLDYLTKLENYLQGFTQLIEAKHNKSLERNSLP
ncbi:restriction endonuclease [Aliarcobacter butzleri]|uniref:restriction endonuclease n=1 Tax=Aliarcobacter butzleri TaxID=28197 RepID=UPI001EDB0CC3|nr:restriction endonuclease [Aliarcobacter butzleri]MCG3667858.1 restriction endonuclease [Aliarcobacter butzleri]